MARFQPRSNIYTLLPILASLVMAAGIAFTWMRIQEYQKPPKPTVLPPPRGRQFPDAPETTPAAKKAIGGELDILTPKGEEPGEAVAPSETAPEAPGEVAPGEAPAAPEVKERVPKEAPPAPTVKAEEEEEEEK